MEDKSSLISFLLITVTIVIFGCVYSRQSLRTVHYEISHTVKGSSVQSLVQCWENPNLLTNIHPLLIKTSVDHTSTIPSSQSKITDLEGMFTDEMPLFGFNITFDYFVTMTLIEPKGQDQDQVTIVSTASAMLNVRVRNILHIQQSSSEVDEVTLVQQSSVSAPWWLVETTLLQAKDSALKSLEALPCI